MKITKTKDHVLFKNKDGEYHLSNAEYKKLGRAKAIKFAESEINKKLNSSVGKTISFKSARAMGFCEYGIEDFCKKLNLDISKEYKIEELRKKLTIEAFLNYPDECVKIFRKTQFSNIEILEFGEVNFDVAKKALNHVINKIKDERLLRLFSCEVALSCLHYFEDKYPDDNRPRLAIEARLAHLKGEITNSELAYAASAAYAAYDAAYAAANAAYAYAAYNAYNANAAYNAYNAANAAAYNAAAAAAANAANSASANAANAAAYMQFCKMLRLAITDKYETYEMFLKISKEN